jgi:hypothetical protein
MDPDKDMTLRNGIYWDPDRFIYVYGISAEEWAARYGITPFTQRCECGKKLVTSIPWAQGSLRGLRTPQCECGSGNRPYCMVRDPRHGDLFSPFAESEPNSCRGSKKHCRHLRLVHSRGSHVSD